VANLKIGQFRLSNRSWTLIVPLGFLLVVSVSWNLRQSRLIAQERLRISTAQHEERALAGEAAERAEALKKKNAKWASSDARLQELYREIDTLSQLNERVLSQPEAKINRTVIIDNPAETLTAP
jgi:cell shape-determining protein MreC